jgi:tetratricopeptide (TPR) repeat protein
MARPAPGRRVRLALAVVCLASVATAVIGAQDAGSPKYSRLQRLAQWTHALERHRPGEADAALEVFGDWEAREFAELKITFYSALQLVRDPTTRTFVRPSSAPAARAIQVFYSRGEVNDLIAVSARLRALGETHMLRRGAMLHTDAVVLGTGTDSRGAARRSDVFIFRFEDGQALNNVDALGQWDVARFLLEHIRPDLKEFQPRPSADDWVRRWYRTLLAFQLARQHFNVKDARRGLELFPSDPEILFFSGVFHETLASPGIQEPFRNSDELKRLVEMGSASDEFNAAERLLKRALKASPDFAEARLHLGRVLAEQDQHDEAMPELMRALSAIKNVDLQYLGHLFAGRSAAALRRFPAARESFERAAALRPSAQSPFLAMSQLAYSRGDVDEAVAMLERVAAQVSLDGDDPWWIYNLTAGRFFTPSYEEIIDDLRKEMGR